VTDPIRIWKVIVADPPAGITTAWPAVAVSAADTPPNHAQLFPANGAAVPPPVPQSAILHSGVWKLVDVCVVHAGHGVPASNVPSAIRFAPPGVQVGVGVADPVPVGVAVAVAVAVGVPVGVTHAPPPNTSENARTVPVSPPALSLAFSIHVPFALWPSNADSGLFGENDPVNGPTAGQKFSIDGNPPSSSSVRLNRLFVAHPNVDAGTPGRS